MYKKCMKKNADIKFFMGVYTVNNGARAQFNDLKNPQCIEKTVSAIHSLQYLLLIFLHIN